MKKTILILVFGLISITIYSQGKFRKGYIIRDNGLKEDCFLKNPGAENKGEDYIFKIKEKGEIEKVSVEDIKEFGIEGELRFIRELIKIDISGDRVIDKSQIGENVRIEEGHAFVKEWINSPKASLYSFNFDGSQFFFYRKENSPLGYLVYKKYEVKAEGIITTEYLTDLRYRNQLKADLPCSADPEKTEYNLGSLMDYFIIYINETGGDYHLNKMPARAKFGIKPAIGLTHSSYFLGDKSMQLDYVDFGPQNSYSYGIGLEYLIKGNRNKLGLFAEANYNSYSSKVEIPTPPEVSEVNYSYIDFPIGLIYRMYLGDRLTLFVKGGGVPNIVLKDTYMTIHNPDNFIELRDAINAMIGFGAEYGIFSLEARYYTNRDLAINVFNHDSKYEQYTLRLALRIFQTGNSND